MTLSKIGEMLRERVEDTQEPLPERWLDLIRGSGAADKATLSGRQRSLRNAARLRPCLRLGLIIAHDEVARTGGEGSQKRSCPCIGSAVRLFLLQPEHFFAQRVVVHSVP